MVKAIVAAFVLRVYCVCVLLPVYVMRVCVLCRYEVAEAPVSGEEPGTEWLCAVVYCMWPCQHMCTFGHERLFPFAFVYRFVC